MKLRWTAGLLIALAAAGCGSKSQTTSHSAAARPTTSASTASPRDCNALGIDPTGMREGTCTEAGTTYVIVDENHTLKLHTLSAHLNGVRAESSVGGASSTVANGKLLVIPLGVTNRLQAAQTFDASGTQQAALNLDRTIYKEDPAAEHADPGSCLRHGAIPAGHTANCDVIFDVPAAAAADVGRHGSGDIYLVDFGSDLAGNTPPQVVGQIRLYH